MIILVDSREQKPLKFNHKYITDTVTTALKVGDYCCKYTDGCLSLTVFERKSISDLFSTLSQGYDRFKREIERGKDLGLTTILITEKTLTDVSRGHTYSKRKGSSIITQMFTLWGKYNIMPVFCSSRAEMSRYISWYYATIGRQATIKEKVALHVRP